ncbi:MAG TPA: biopolymer transporter ExbD [Candidatus Sulfotelmatobacter sp.]|nr:biopolymer transporter ExbD [Candidatus Sulfotelmatobacter sp.]
MKRILEVCLVAFTLSMNMPSAPAQSPALRKGVSVQMAATGSATPMPEADNQDAWIVTITADGKLYFGADPVDAGGLMNDMKIHPRKRDAKLYIKADARAPFNSVEKVLEIGRKAYFESAVFLTKQNETPALGKMVAPQGLEILLTSAPSDAVVVELPNPDQSQASLKVDNREVARANLQNALNQSLQNRADRIVEIKAEGSLPFAQVAQVIDACASVKAKVVRPAEE